MSSLPSWVDSALDFNATLSAAAINAPTMRNITGNPTTRTNTMMNGPKSTRSFLPEVGPGFDLDESSDREVGNADRGTGRPVVAERVDVHLVHQRVIAHVLEEDGG